MKATEYLYKLQGKVQSTKLTKNINQLQLYSNAETG